jgi:ribosome-binding factor A
MSRRTERVSELIRHELSDLLMRELRDPRLDGLISITRVDLSPDLYNARVFVSVMS